MIENMSINMLTELLDYSFPSVELLCNYKNKEPITQDEIEEIKNQIIKILNYYRIKISNIETTIGPQVTLFEIVPPEGVLSTNIKRYEDDISLILRGRIVAPISGKGTIGIEIPNKNLQVVSLRSIIESNDFQNCNYQLPIVLGKYVTNEPAITDLTQMPHLLVAGFTKQGKSVGLNAIIASLLYKKRPSELKFVLIDPKMVEFNFYARLKDHYIAQIEDEGDPIITDVEKAERMLNSLCIEMDNRYNLLHDAGAISIIDYNEKFKQHRLKPEKGHRYLPYIVIIIDEFADLIYFSSRKAIEAPIACIAQKARAVGMHMIIATQRLSAKVITSIISANFPGRIAFRVATKFDSKVILDRPGAEKLIGRGDMLFSHNGTLNRVQGAVIETPQVESIIDSICKQPSFETPYYLPNLPIVERKDSFNKTVMDPLFKEAAYFVCSQGFATTSSLQRKYSIGYNRARKIMDQLEKAGIVGKAEPQPPRTILVDSSRLNEILK